MRRWIRLDVEWEESAWLDALSGQAAGCWPRLLCWVKLRGKRGRCRAPDPSVLARRWRVPRQAVDELLAAAEASGVARRDRGDVVVESWDQYLAPPIRPRVLNRWRRIRLAVLDRDNWTCTYCGRPADQCDHVVPRAAGGSDDLANLVACCGVCNRKKGPRTPEQWGEGARA